MAATEDLSQWEDPLVGTLPNGVQYVILRNTTPPDRVEAHLEVCVGSAHEKDDQQGIAHFLEHVVFNGTEKYPTAESLRQLLASWGMNFGGDANAFTDFRQTVYTLHAPVVDPLEEDSHEGTEDELEDGKRNEDDALENDANDNDDTENIIRDEAIWNRASSSSLEENTLFRVLTVLHQLGRKALIEAAGVDLERGAVLGELRESNGVDHRVDLKWYKQVHGDTCLWDRFPIGKQEQIERFTAEDITAFYREHYIPPNFTVYIVGAIDVHEAELFVREIFSESDEEEKPKVENEPNINTSISGTKHSASEKCSSYLMPKQRIHRTFSAPAIPFDTFQHHLISDISITFSMLRPLTPLRTHSDYKIKIVEELVQLAFDHRVTALVYSLANPPFVELDWDSASSYSDDCVVHGVSICCRSSEWKEALLLSMKEVMSVYTYGLTLEELQYAKDVLIKSYEDDAEMLHTTKSGHLVEELMDSVALGDVILSRKQELEIAQQIMSEIDGDLIRESIHSLLSFVAMYSLEQDDSSSLFITAPQGARIEKSDVLKIMNDARRELDFPQFVFEVTPTLLKSASDLQRVHCEWKRDEKSDAIFGKLANGIHCAMKRTTFEESQCTFEIRVTGGLMAELKREQLGLTVLALEALFDGDVTAFSADQIDRYRSLHGITLSFHVDHDFMLVRISFSVTNQGTRKACELLHLFLVQVMNVNRRASAEEDCGLDWKAFARAKKNKVIEAERKERDIESKIASILGHSVFSDDRFCWFSPSHYDALSLLDATELLATQFHPQNLSISVVGDIELEDVKMNLETYVGTIMPPAEVPAFCLKRDMLRQATSLAVNHSGGFYTCHMIEESERAFVSICVSGINRWGDCHDSFHADHPCLTGFVKHGFAERDNETTESRQDHPLYHARCQGLLIEIINNRLYKQIRENAGLLYSIHMQRYAPDFLPSGLLWISLSPYPDKVNDTIDMALSNISQIAYGNITEEEFLEAKNPFVEDVSERMNDNSFWISAMRWLHIPPRRISLLHDIADQYKDITLEDITTFASSRLFRQEDVMEGCSLPPLHVVVGCSGPQPREVSVPCLQKYTGQEGKGDLLVIEPSKKAVSFSTTAVRDKRRPGDPSR